MVRHASAQPRIDGILSDIRDALMKGFQARGLWIQTIDEDGHGTGAVYSADGVEVVLTDELTRIAEAAARRAWDGQRVEIVQRGRPFGELVSAADGRADPGLPRHHRHRARCCSPRSAPAPSASATWC